MNYLFKLYVTGHTPNSVRAISNLKRLLDSELKSLYTLTIIDVLKNPQLALEDRILATPTLIRVLPPPEERVIGDLSDRQRVLSGLYLAAKPEERVGITRGGHVRETFERTEAPPPAGK